MKRKDGISLSIPLKEIHGLAQVGKDFLAKISLTNFDFDVYDESKIIQEENNLDKITTNKLQFNKRISFNTVESRFPTAYYDIKTLFWEFESGMLEHRPNIFKNINEVIAFTDFIYNYLLKIAPKDVKITKMKYPFIANWQIVMNKSQVREKYNISAEDFVCFFNFDYRSSYDRKNPEMTIRAFAESIGQNDDVKMIIKTSGFNDLPYQVEKINSFVKILGLDNKIIFINEYLSRNEIISIMDACDCYISLHRGEGLGLGMLESMALSKPVIATNYSGNTEFTREDNSLLVDYKLIDAADSSGPYFAVKKWADPNIETAKEHLFKLYSDREFARKIGEKAKQFIDEYYDLDSFKLDIERIFQIEEKEDNPQCLSQSNKKVYFSGIILDLIKNMLDFSTIFIKKYKSCLCKAKKRCKLLLFEFISYFLYRYDFKNEYKKIPPNFNMPFSENPVVSIIITAYNQYEYTKACLWSILNNTKDIPYEIIIGDNVSGDETKNILQNIGGIKVVRHTLNEGFLMNANKTVPYAKGKYIVLLNNDIVVKKNWLKFLLETIEKDEKIGYVGSKYLYPDGLICEAGAYIAKDGLSYFYNNKALPINKNANKEKEVDYCSGCGVILRKATWDKLGGFDERYKPGYYEDVDLCFQIKYDLGQKIIYQPKSEMYHFHSMSYSKEKVEISNKNRVEFMKKWIRFF